MTSITPTSTSPLYGDRAALIQRMVANSSGKLSAEEASTQVAQSERDQLLFIGLQEALSSGRLKIPDGAAIAERLQSSRLDAFSSHPGPITISAMNVDSAIGAQSTLTGGDLKNLSLYMDHLRSGVNLASQVKSEVTFFGAWGADKMTNNVEEYIGWLQSAMQTQPAASRD